MSKLKHRRVQEGVLIRHPSTPDVYALIRHPSILDVYWARYGKTKTVVKLQLASLYGKLGTVLGSRAE